MIQKTGSWSTQWVLSKEIMVEIIFYGILRFRLPAGVKRICYVKWNYLGGWIVEFWLSTQNNGAMLFTNDKKVCET